MGRYKTTCSIECLPVIRKFVREELKVLEVPDAITPDIVLAVDEACANSIIHQHNNDGTSQIELNIYRSGEKLIIELKDKGEAFPIDMYKPIHMKVLLKNRIQGKLGIHLITSIMDKIEVKQGQKYFVYKFTKLI